MVASVLALTLWAPPPATALPADHLAALPTEPASTVPAQAAAKRSSPLASQVNISRATHDSHHRRGTADLAVRRDLDPAMRPQWTTARAVGRDLVRPAPASVLRQANLLRAHLP